MKLFTRSDNEFRFFFKNLSRFFSEKDWSNKFLFRGKNRNKTKLCFRFWSIFIRKSHVWKRKKSQIHRHKQIRKKFWVFTAQSPWDWSIISILEPSLYMALFQYFWRFTQICKEFAALERKNVFVIVSEQISCKSSEILKQYDAKWWLNYRIYGSVSYSFSCK